MNIAVFIDFDNIEIGVKSTLGEHFDVGAILDAIKERGEVVTKIAYADWTRAGEYSRHLTQHAIRLVQRNLTPGGDKNGADINLALDALEMAFTHPHINAYVIVGGDSDFLSLVEKLKQYDKKVFVVGGRAFTSIILQRNCHEFIAYENLPGVRKQAAMKGGRPAAVSAASPIAQAFPIVRRALKILADREVTPQTGLLKSTLLQLDSTFSERNYAASSFLDFVEKLALAGFISLKHTGRSVTVELNQGFTDDADTADQKVRTATESEGVPAAIAQPSRSVVEQTQMYRTADAAQLTIPDDDAQPFTAPERAELVGPPSGEARMGELRTSDGSGSFRSHEQVRQTESNADGVLRAGQLLGAAVNARWPMYLRNVKQILRQAEGGFDERRYGFGGLMDLLRACQKEGLVRIERDRRGGLRVLQGPALQRGIPTVPKDGLPEEPADVVDVTPVEEHPGNVAEARQVDVEQSESEPIVPMGTIDTTAELLGRAKQRRPSAAGGRGRTRTPRPQEVAAPRQSARAGQSKAAVKKPAARRAPRAKKAAAGDNDTEK